MEAQNPEEDHRNEERDHRRMTIPWTKVMPNGRDPADGKAQPHDDPWHVAPDHPTATERPAFLRKLGLGSKVLVGAPPKGERLKAGHKNEQDPRMPEKEQ